MVGVDGDDDVPCVQVDDGSYRLCARDGPVAIQFVRLPPAKTPARAVKPGKNPARQAKYPRTSAPKRRGRKPERTRVEQRRDKVVVPEGKDSVARAQALFKKMMSPEALRTLAAEVDTSDAGYIP